MTVNECLLLALVFWIVCGIVCGATYGAKYGHDWLMWFTVLFLGPLAIGISTPGDGG